MKSKEKENMKKHPKHNAKKRKTSLAKLSRQRINLIHHRNLSVTSLFFFVFTSVIANYMHIDMHSCCVSHSTFNFVDIFN